MMRTLGLSVVLVMTLTLTLTKRVDDPDKFLEKFGYLREPLPGVQHSPKAREEAIKTFQRMTGLSPTGKLDSATLRKMGAPRCGMPDMIPSGPGVEVPPDVAFDPSQNPQNFYVPGYKWKKTSLTWKTLNYSPDMNSGSQRRAFYQAFEHWSKVSPLTFRETSSSSADIEIKFAPGRGDHGDGAGNAFDGPGGTLAHAFYPENGDTHFDESETWTEYTDQGTNLMIVAAHEFGHALGLGHSNIQEALMAPYYQGYDANFELHTDDIQAIQSLYGGSNSPRTTTTPRPNRPPRPTPSKKPGGKPDSCTTKFGAILQGGDGYIHVFDYKWVWKLNIWSVENDARYPILAKKLYNPPPPYNIGAAVYSWRTRYTYFFKGAKVFKYYGSRRIQAKTIRTSGYPRGVQAAFMGRDGNLYLLKGAEYWVFDEYNMDVQSTRGRSIASKWPGIPPNIEAAVRLNDGYLYFFKGQKYRKYDEGRRQVLPGYPKLKAGPWMGPTCGGSYVPK